LSQRLNKQIYGNVQAYRLLLLKSYEKTKRVNLSTLLKITEVMKCNTGDIMDFFNENTPSLNQKNTE